MKTQDYSNHTRPPWRTIGLFLLSAVGAAYWVIETIDDPSPANFIPAVLAIVLTYHVRFARHHALGVQDRVIRLEERLRLARLLPNETASRIEELTTEQLVGLRFASDGEVADLVGRVLNGELATRKEIKQAVREWRADHQRI